MKWIITISAVMNSILLMTVTGIIPFFFFLSLVVNIALLWYILSSLKQYEELDEDIGTILDKTFALEEHLITIYQMEMFYGDETLRSLIEHTKETVTDLENYRFKYSLGTSEYDDEESQEEQEEQKEPKD